MLRDRLCYSLFLPKCFPEYHYEYESKTYVPKETRTENE